MPQPPTVRHQHVAEDILAKAAILFDERGYGMTTLQDIADAVGVARQSLYHYVKSKDEILVALVERTSATREAIVAEVTSLAASPKERLTKVLTEVGRSIAAEPVGLRLALGYGGSLPRTVQQRSLRSRRLMFELIVTILGDGVVSGELLPTDERQAAASIIAALSGLQYQDIGGVHMEPDVAAAQLVQILLAGISRADDRPASSALDAVQRLRDDIDLLEHHVRRTPPEADPGG